MFRYQLICPRWTPTCRPRPAGGWCGRSPRAPTPGRSAGSTATPATRWTAGSAATAGGLDALAPSTRQPGSRIDTTVLELAAALKENPDRTAAGRADPARLLGLVAVGIDAAAAVPPPRPDRPPTAGRVRPVRGRGTERTLGRRRVARPRVGGRKTYLFAFLDDHSRLGRRVPFGFAEDTVRLAAALQPASPRVPPASTSTTAAPTSIPGCCAPAASSASG